MEISKIMLINYLSDVSNNIAGIDKSLYQKDGFHDEWQRSRTAGLMLKRLIEYLRDGDNPTVTQEDD